MFLFGTAVVPGHINGNFDYKRSCLKERICRRHFLDTFSLLAATILVTILVALAMIGFQYLVCGGMG